MIKELFAKALTLLVDEQLSGIEEVYNVGTISILSKDFQNKSRKNRPSKSFDIGA